MLQALRSLYEVILSYQARFQSRRRDAAFWSNLRIHHAEKPIRQRDEVAGQVIRWMNVTQYLKGRSWIWKAVWRVRDDFFRRNGLIDSGWQPCINAFVFLA
jgi:hypothetical protein